MTRTEHKLLEAKFFLKHVEEHWRRIPHVDFYLSAFISSARSVTWVMRSEFGRVPGWKEWYESKSPAAEVQEFLRTLNAIRVRSEKTEPLGTTTKAELHFAPDQVTPELKAVLNDAAQFRLIPVDHRNLEFDIVVGGRTVARGVLHSAQHELVAFPGEDALVVGRRYIGLLEPLVNECTGRFSHVVGQDA